MKNIDDFLAQGSDFNNLCIHVKYVFKITYTSILFFIRNNNSKWKCWMRVIDSLWLEYSELKTLKAYLLKRFNLFMTEVPII